MEKRPHSETAVAEATKENKTKGKLSDFFFGSKKVSQLVLKIVLALVVPYLYLLAWGFIEQQTGAHQLVPFIFYSFIAFYIVAFVLIIAMIVRFVKARRKR